MTASKKLIQASAGNVGGGDFYPYTIDNSARFNGSDNAYLAKTFSNTPTSRTTCTDSVWVKLTGKRNGSNINTLFGTAGNWEALSFVEPGNINGWRADQIRSTGMTSPQPTLRTASVYRDYSGWFHFIRVWDSTNATAADRHRLYINGVRLTDFDQQVNASLNQQLVEWLSTSGATNIGISGGSTIQSFDGYMAEVVVLDGTAASPTDLGELKNGVWVPKDPSGLTFGTNGFYLDFSNSAALGTDVSGNGNNFTSSGLTSSDQMTDTPTNNYCTLNSVWNAYSGQNPADLSDGNLQANFTGTTSKRLTTGTIGLPSTGEWYWEINIDSVGELEVGIIDQTKWSSYSSYKTSWYQNSSAGNTVYVEGSIVTTGGVGFTTGDVIGIYFNADSSQISWYKNGTIANSSPYTLTNVENLGLFCHHASGGGTAQLTLVTSPDDFSYTAPGSALALCTANLPEPAIGPNSTIKPSDVFGVELSTGNGTAKASGGKMIFEDVDFTDGDYMVWGKNRDATDSWACFDTLRGSDKYIILDGNLVNTTNTETLEFTSAGCKLGNSHLVNASGEDYVFYMFKVTPGFFDMQQFTSTGSVLNVSHDLGVAPKMVIGNNYSGIQKNWIVQVDGGQVTDPETDYLLLDLNYAATDDATVWNDTAPTDAVVTIGTNANLNNSTPYEGILYMFADVEGFCKTGYYKGNGSADGPFEYLGFSPDFRVTKSSSLAQAWVVQDTERTPANVNTDILLFDTSAAEVTGSTNQSEDLLSNGVKLRATGNSHNATSADYITLSIGTSSKYSNAR